MSKKEKVVVLDMQNQNALISMACVSQFADNPYSVFCEYLKYCIFTHTEGFISIVTLRKSVNESFGIELPHNIIVNCLSVLQKEGLISVENYSITKKGEYDIESFEKTRTEYRRIESDILSKLCDYSSAYGERWSEEYARSMLIRILDKQGLAFDVFINDGAIKETMEESKIPDDDYEVNNDSDPLNNSPLFSDENLAGRFVRGVLNSDSSSKDYLLKICEGLMICVGSYQLPSDGTNGIKSSIKNTPFIFDTRLLLRFVGCAGEAAVSAAKELVKLIQDGEGLIYYYPQTKQEMERAFDNAISDLSNDSPPNDFEMRLYASNIANSIPILRAKKANLTNELAASNIYEIPLGSYSDIERIKFGFDFSVLREYMRSKLPWEDRTINNDALSIWETHMRRKGNYDDYCGTSKHLDVFVTSNARLIRVAMDFKKDSPYLQSIQSWKTTRLPLITDIRLMCRLWSPAEQVERISQLYLTSNVIAALRPTKKYVERIKELAIKLREQVPEYSGISLPAYFDDNISEAMLRTTKGNDDNLDLGSFASTLSELTEWKSKEKDELIKSTNVKLEQANNTIAKQTESIISDAVNCYKNKLGWRKLVLWIIKEWVIVLTVLWSIIAIIISYFTNNWNIMWSILFLAFAKVLELIFASNRLEKIIMKLVLPKVVNSFASKITKKLRPSEIPYSEEIVRQSVEQTKLICKCRELIQ